MSSYTELQIDQLINKVEKFNYIKFGLALFIALTSAILVSDLIKWKVATVYLEMAAKEMEQKLKAEAALATARMKKETENLATRNAEIARQQENYQAEQRRIANANRIRNENAAEAQKKLMKTCKFWIAEFNKSKAEGDRNHRNNACRDAGTPFN